MTPSEIKAAICKAGTNQTAIATHLEVSIGSVWRVIHGKMRSAKIEAELEKITGKPIHEARSRTGRPKATWNGAVSGVSA